MSEPTPVQQLQGVIDQLRAECDRLRGELAACQREYQLTLQRGIQVGERGKLAETAGRELDDAAWTVIQELERNGSVTSATYNALHRAHGNWQKVNDG